MQGEVGRALYGRFRMDSADPESLLVVQGDSALRDSDAVLAIWSGLPWPWRALTVFRDVPRPMRDWAYRILARNRYRWFGKRKTCWMPSPEQRSRIL
jgi:predicted DCC family thiol-disulfide oxidoreductase YuxK